MESIAMIEIRNYTKINVYFASIITDVDVKHIHGTINDKQYCELITKTNNITWN